MFSDGQSSDHQPPLPPAVLSLARFSLSVDADNPRRLCRRRRVRRLPLFSIFFLFASNLQV
ncbi:hypothetical protein HanXRQr2_Chr10g0440391 [Helianthus annuus]|uniref:Uncharacterized protein n=1 Tax=Helianthus annuus TaxID=4232 RepID=A0A9K3HY36_HELAN|nr:hypothetical protein HanXRQr2_Chr10g0440391 [Helianthus annuus]